METPYGVAPYRATSFQKRKFVPIFIMTEHF